MRHGYHNVFGDERMTTELFNAGGILRALATDWVLGTPLAGVFYAQLRRRLS